MMTMAPFELRPPSSPAVPLLFDSPHSGRFYPEDFRFRPPLEHLRQGEDAYVDELIADAPAEGATVLLALYPRCYIDANRDADDIDAALLAEPWPAPLAPSDKTRLGLGLIRRFVTPGVEVHRERLSVAEVQGRIDRIYRPYHQALQDQLADLRDRFGTVWHIDWHSMKSVGNAMTVDNGARRPEFVLGDLDGTSCEPALTDLAATTLRGLGYQVAINKPYKGAAIVRRCGAPIEGRHSLQIEINRALYLDEVQVEKHAGFERLRGDIGALTAKLAAALRERIGT
jgi:N-formylglutamate deformylase